MKRFLIALFLAMAAPAFADDLVGADSTNICEVTTTSPTAVSTSSDSDCVWSKGAALSFQCSGDVYYSKIHTATDKDAKVTTGDPYLIKLKGQQLHVSLLAVSGAVTCRFYFDTRNQ